MSVWFFFLYVGVMAKAWMKYPVGVRILRRCYGFPGMLKVRDGTEMK